MRRVGILFLALAFTSIGCVERLLAVRSEPEGATVYLDGERVGETPIDIPFTWYGTRELILEKPEYREIREKVALAPPWWQWPGLDFITDVVIPFRLRDRREVTFHLERAPLTREELDEVLRRAEELRRQAGVPE